MGRRCCIGPVTRFDTSDYEVHVAGEMRRIRRLRARAHQEGGATLRALRAVRHRGLRRGDGPGGPRHGRRGRHARGLRVRHGHRRDRRAAERVFHLGRKGAQAREPAVHPHHDRQHRGGQPVYPLRASGRVPERRDGLRHRGALHRLGRAGHPSRLHRRGPGRRLRGERLAHLPCRVRQPGRAVQGRRPPAGVAAVRRAPQRASWRARAPARWCWSRWSMRSARGAHGARRGHGLRLHGRRLPHDGPRARRARAWSRAMRQALAEGGFAPEDAGASERPRHRHARQRRHRGARRSWSCAAKRRDAPFRWCP